MTFDSQVIFATPKWCGNAPRFPMVLCIYRTLNHIDHNALWIDLNAENIDRNASQRNADVYVKQLHLLT